MRRTLAILNELLLAWAVALCAGTALAGGYMLAGLQPLLILQPAATSLVWIGPALVLVWLASAGMFAVARAMGLEWSRLHSARALRPLLLGLLALAQPLIGYAGIALPLLTLGAAGSLWRWWSLLQSSDAAAGLPKGIESALERLGDGRAAAALFVLALIVYAFFASGLISALPDPNGDEPHYLIISYSLLADGDVELSNNYYENRDYRLWHSYEGPAVGYAHTKKGAGGNDQEFSMHTSGLPAYLAPFLAIGLWCGNPAAVHFFTRLGMTLPAAAFIALLFLTLRRLDLDRRTALGATLLAAITAPVLFFSFHIFTELPAALLCLFAFHHLWPDRPPSWLPRIFVGLALGTLPWLGPKYLALAAPLGILWTVRERRWGIEWRKAAALALPGLVVLLAFLWHTYALFGTFNPSAYYVGAGGSILDRNPVFKVGHAGGLLEAGAIAGKTALSYWVDQKEGLLAFAPWFLLALSGWIGMLLSKQHRRLALWLLGLAGPFYLLYSLTGFGGGHSPPARAVTSIIWAFIIPAAWMLPRALRRARELTFALIIVSLIITAVLLLQPAFLYHDFHVRASHILTALSTPFLDATALFPSVNNKHFENWPVALPWIALLAGAALWIALRRDTDRDHQIRWAGASVVFLALAVLLWAGLAKTPPLEAQSYRGAARDLDVLLQRGAFHLERDSFWVRTSLRGECYLLSNGPAAPVTLHLRTVVPNAVRLYDGVSTFELRLVARKRGELTITPRGGFRIGDRWLTRIAVESTRGVPPGSGLLTGDDRDLGAEVTFR